MKLGAAALLGATLTLNGCESAPPAPQRIADMPEGVEKEVAKERMQTFNCDQEFIQSWDNSGGTPTEQPCLQITDKAVKEHCLKMITQTKEGIQSACRSKLEGKVVNCTAKGKEKFECK